VLLRSWSVLECAPAQPIDEPILLLIKRRMSPEVIDNRRRPPVAKVLEMTTKRSKSAQRKPRADAQRNRERILEVAKDAFTRSNGEINLDDVARQAGGGAGTVYRH